MATNYWNGSLAQFLLNKIRLKDGVSFEQLGANPTVVAAEANTGSLGIFGTALYQKQDSGSTTNWADLTAPVVVALQEAYDNSADGTITLDATRAAFKLKDNSTPLAQELFEILNDAETIQYFQVSASHTSITDADGTLILRKESDLTFIEDFKVNLPSAAYTTTGLSGSMINDNTATRISGHMSAGLIIGFGGDAGNSATSSAVTGLENTDYQEQDFRLEYRYAGADDSSKVVLEESSDGVSYTTVGEEFLKNSTEVLVARINMKLLATSTHYRHRIESVVDGTPQLLTWDNITAKKSGEDLKQAYNNSDNGDISLDTTRGAVKIKDNATPINAPLLQVTNDSESQAYFDVAASRTNILDAEGQFTLRPRDYRFEEDFKENLPDTVYTTSGLGGSVANNNTTPLDGLLSARYTIIGGDLNGEILSPAITNLKPVDYELLGLQLDTGYNGNYGDWELFVQESVDDVTYTDVNSEGLKIGFNTAKTSQINFTLPSTAVYYRYKFVCKNESVGAQLDWDNIKVARNPLNYKITAEENNYSARISNNGTAAIISENSKFIDTVNRSAVGRVEINYVSGFFTVIPSVVSVAHETLANPDTTVTIESHTTSQLVIYFGNSSAGFNGIDVDFDFAVQRQASDYKYPLENVVQLGQTSALDTQSYTPTFTGLGTTTEQDITWRQDGDVAVVEGFFRAGTVSATDASFTLPNSFTSKLTNNYPISGYYRYVGTLKRGNTDTEIALIMEENSNIVFFASTSFFIPSAGSNLIVSNEYLSFRMEVPVNELSADSIMYSFSPTKHVTDGTEYPVPETIDNIQVYARTVEITSDITSSSLSLIDTFPSGLLPLDAVNWEGTSWDLTGFSRSGSGDNQASVFYNSANGELRALVTGSYKIGQGVRITMRYTK